MSQLINTADHCDSRAKVNVARKTFAKTPILFEQTVFLSVVGNIKTLHLQMFMSQKEATFVLTSDLNREIVIVVLLASCGYDLH